MSTYEMLALMIAFGALMIAFGSLIVMLIDYLDKRK